MTKINSYSASPQSGDGSAPKGSVYNPYTQEEFNSMSDAGTWPDGHVIGMGYVLPGVYICASSDSDSVSSSDSWNDPWESTSDPWGSSGEDEASRPSGDGGSDTSGSGSIGGNNYGEGTPGGNNSGSGVTGGNGGALVAYSVSKAVNYLVAHAYPCYNSECGHCARAVREALEAGGLSTVSHPVGACDYDSFLPHLGFHTVDKNTYSPMKGDVIVLEAVPNHPYGHIAMFSGNAWISDFVQVDMWGGSAFRNIAEYTIFRR